MELEYSGQSASRMENKTLEGYQQKIGVNNMPYIICNDDNYLKQDKKCRYSIVHEMSEATKWSNLTKASNVQKRNPNKLCVKYQLEVKYVSQKNSAYNPVAQQIELGYDILDKVKEISAFSKEIEERRLYLIEMIHNIDLEIVDIEHAAEFYILNAAQGYKIYKMLHDARTKRRSYKDELKKIDLSLGTSIRSKNMENLQKSIVGLDNRKYEPRVIKELFEI